ncbi:MAG: hypothetical protein QXK88_11785 [Desulfurococcaceae archaeon]
MVGIIGIFERSATSTDLSNHADELVDECLSPWTQNRINRVIMSDAILIMILSERDKLYHLSFREEKKLVAIYGYVWPEFKVVENLINKALVDKDTSLDNLVNIVRSVDGSFVIVIRDNERLFIITDRFASRPIYYAITDIGMIFSSCIWSLLKYFKLRKIPIKINEKAVVSYLWFGKIGILGSDTFINGIYTVPAASVLAYNLKEHSVSIIQYWDLDYSGDIDDEEIAARLIYKSLMRAVIKISEMAKKNNITRICLELSGGLDSRTISLFVTLLSRLRYQFDLQALTFGSRKCDEVIISKFFTRMLGIKHVVKATDPYRLAIYAKKVVEMTDGFDTVNKAHVLLAAEMLRLNGCEAFVTGFMLDLLLGGSFMSADIMKIKTSNEFLSQLYEKSRVFTHEELLQLLTDALKPQLMEVLRTFKHVALSSVTATRVFADANDYFFIHTRVRRNTVYGSVVQRNVATELLPTIDKDVISSITSVHPKLRYKYRVYRKLILSINKYAALIPYQKTWTPPLLPHPLWNLGYILKNLNNIIYKLTRGKVGIETIYFDYGRALRESLSWKRLMLKTLLYNNAAIYKLGYVKRDYVIKMLREHLNGSKDHADKLVFLISLELYLKGILKFIGESLYDETIGDRWKCK